MHRHTQRRSSAPHLSILASSGLHRENTLSSEPPASSINSPELILQSPFCVTPSIAIPHSSDASRTRSRAESSVSPILLTQGSSEFFDQQLYLNPIDVDGTAFEMSLPQTVGRSLFSHSVNEIGFGILQRNRSEEICHSPPDNSSLHKPRSSRHTSASSGDSIYDQSAPPSLGTQQREPLPFFTSMLRRGANLTPLSNKLDTVAMELQRLRNELQQNKNCEMNQSYNTFKYVNDQSIKSEYELTRQSSYESTNSDLNVQSSGRQLSASMSNPCLFEMQM